MEANAHFEGIQERILEILNQARFEVTIAIAWFTAPELFDQLCRLAAKGVNVGILLMKDEINTGRHGLNFQRLRDAGGQVHFVPDPRRGGATMHNKFAVIDREIVVTGSYNWSRQARSNHENITVISGDRELAARYLSAWRALLERYGHPGGQSVAIDPTLISHRLQLVKNFILLGELEDIQVQIERLRPFAADQRLAEILDLLEKTELDTAVARIDRYPIERLAVVSVASIELEAMRLELTTLEIELTAISNEKDEIERQVGEYDQRSTRELGELVTEYLRLRRELLARERVASATTDDEYREADDEYNQYREAHEAAKQAPEKPQLDSTQQQELKGLYRRASRLCHPDKVAEVDKEQAHGQFVALQQAYRDNNIAGVRRILEHLRSGRMFADLTESLSDADLLRRQIVQMRLKIERLMDDIDRLRASETFQFLRNLTNWVEHFARRREQLEVAIEGLRGKVSEGAP